MIEGTQVTWTSQSQGVCKTKVGEIMEFIPAGQRIQSDFSLVPKSHLKFTDVPSKFDRYLVKISIVNKKGVVNHYYCPKASSVKIS